MQPYDQTHSTGVLYLPAVTSWYLMEVAAKRLVPLTW